MDWTVLGMVLVAVITGVVSWVVRGRVEDWQKVRDLLRKEQRERYAQILNPYVQAFATPGRTQEVAAIIKSAEYRKEVFDFALVADDAVINAYLTMMRRAKEVKSVPTASGKSSTPPKPEEIEMLRSFGVVLLNLRKSVGNRKTRLSPEDMLRVVGVNDVDKYFSQTALHEAQQPSRQLTESTAD